MIIHPFVSPLYWRIFRLRLLAGQEEMGTLCSSLDNHRKDTFARRESVFFYVTENHYLCTKIRAMNIWQKETEIIDTINALDGWIERYDYIQQLAPDIPACPELRPNIITTDGCRSTNYWKVEVTDNIVHLHGRSSSSIVLGLMGLLYNIYDGQPVEDVENFTPSFVIRTGLDKNLSYPRHMILQKLIARINESLG